MTDIEKIAQDGFILSDVNKQLTDVALLSLRTALKAYFSTYRTMKESLFLLGREISGLSQEDNQRTLDYHHYPDYCEAYSESVIHFHHFIELTIKELLRGEHSLLATDASDKPDILYKMLKEEDISAIEHGKLKSIEFSVAERRLRVLVEKKLIPNHKQLEFIVRAKPWLDELNGLRNRLIHRGTFILRYTALDRLVGKYVLPFVRKALKLPIYSHSEFKWRYRRLHCKIDPITSIVKEAANTKPDVRKMALLKELGRAAYENPLHHGPLRLQKQGLRILEGGEADAERFAKVEEGHSDAVKIRVCPVCGVKALTVYGATRADEYREEFYTYAVRCLCCSFEIGKEIESESFAGLTIKSYWRVEELS